MSKIDTIRAWKDEAYRRSLSEAELAKLPQNPAGLIELSDNEMELVAGGSIYPTASPNLSSVSCCWMK